MVLAYTVMMRRTFGLTVTVVLCLLRAANAQPGSTTGPSVPSVPAAVAKDTCSHEEIGKQRSVAEGHLRRGALLESQTVLEKLVKRCAGIMSAWASAEDAPRDRSFGGKAPNFDYYWMYSDLAYVLYRQGKFEDCQGALGTIVTHKAPEGIEIFQELLPNWPELKRVYEALGHNFSLCVGAISKRRQADKYAAKPCPFKGIPGIAVPPQGLDSSIEAACLELQSPEVSSQDERHQALEAGTNSADKLCPKVIVRKKRRGVALWEKQVLVAEHGTLLDDNHCCNLDAISVAQIAGKLRISVTGSGRNCFGGTAYSNSATDYLWIGGTLQQVDGFFYSEH